MKLVSDRYTIYINGNSVTMACNHTRMPHSLSNLCITFNDLAFYLQTQREGNEGREKALKEVILSGNIKRLNTITGQNFIQA